MKATATFYFQYGIEIEIKAMAGGVQAPKLQYEFSYKSHQFSNNGAEGWSNCESCDNNSISSNRVCPLKQATLTLRKLQ